MRVRWAWDSRTSLEDGGLFVTESVPKVVEVDDFGPIGGAGDSGSIAEGFAVFCSTDTLDRAATSIGRLGLDEEHDAEWMLWWDDSLCLVSRRGVVTRPVLSFFAIGMAWQIALGAMAHRASAERAVHIACAMHASCGEPVHTVEWRPER